MEKLLCLVICKGFFFNKKKKTSKQIISLYIYMCVCKNHDYMLDMVYLFIFYIFFYISLKKSCKKKKKKQIKNLVKKEKKKK